jgi:hypothetical protein
VTDVEQVPCLVSDACQTVEAAGIEADRIRRHLEMLTSAIRSGSSDRLHYEHASSRFWTQYVRSWRDEYRAGGIGVLVRKALNLRAYHFKLIAGMILAKARPRPRADDEPRGPSPDQDPAS